MAAYLTPYMYPWLAYLLVGLVQCGLLLTVILLVAAVCTPVTSAGSRVEPPLRYRAAAGPT